MKNKVFYVILALVFLAGLSLLLYPIVSDAYNSHLQSQAIAEYTQQVNTMARETNEKEWEKAHAYNESIPYRDNPFEMSEEELAEYESLLDLTGQGIMAYIEIPSIGVTLPIAHGVEEDTLQDKIGHLEWSSLPVGGENSHCVVSGHRGLPSSELFTNIDHLAVGDTFYIHVLDRTLKYTVCHIAVVEPEDQGLLRIQAGEDLVTLVTCTPYGINSHRLLVRGMRVGTATQETTAKLPVKNEITSFDTLLLVALGLVAIGIVAFGVLLFSRGKKKK